MTDLYRMDFHTWARRQSALESVRHTAGLEERDREELEDLARRGRELWIEAATATITHLLRIQHCPAAPAEKLDHWRMRVSVRRIELDRLLPGLRARPDALLDEAWGVSREAAVRGRLAGGSETSRIPEQCPWSLEQIAHRDWWPGDRWPVELHPLADPAGEPPPPPSEAVMPGPFHSCSQYADTIDNAWNDDERYRMLISDLPRRFHARSREAQAKSLEDPPRLTGTKWDALLAAVAEHIAITHGHPVPDWCDDPERSLKIYWMPLPVFGKRFPGCYYRDTPGAFLRHGVIIGGRELGPREGERDYGALLGECA